MSIVAKMAKPVLRFEETRSDPTAFRVVEGVAVNWFHQTASYRTHRFAGAVAIEGFYSGPFGATAPFSMLLDYF